jgi:hypothetical protein
MEDNHDPGLGERTHSTISISTMPFFELPFGQRREEVGVGRVIIDISFHSSSKKPGASIAPTGTLPAAQGHKNAPSSSEVSSLLIIDALVTYPSRISHDSCRFV